VAGIWGYKEIGRDRKEENDKHCPPTFLYSRRWSHGPCMLVSGTVYTWTRHFLTFRDCLPVPSENSSVPQLVSHPLWLYSARTNCCDIGHSSRLCYFLI